MAQGFGPVSVRRLALVHPKLSFLMGQLDAQMSEPLGITQGLRISAEQHALFAQGRMSLEDVNALRAAVQWAPILAVDNKKVTNAPPGYSWHEFGMAVDVVPFESGGLADWNETHPVWQEILTKGQALGLKSGISWKDEPHFQCTGRFPDTPTDEVRTIYQQGGVKAVWEAAGIAA
jgi:peptidoglycan L-alanyl-D-glutamate endopeptidase CwlK